MKLVTEGPLLASLILAGRRTSENTALDKEDKACLEVAGVPMILRVYDCLETASTVSRPVISIGETSGITDFPELQGVGLHRSRSSPASSVFDYFVNHHSSGPLLVTTADHALLTPEMVEYFCHNAMMLDADIVVAVVSASVLRRRFPCSRRTFFSFADGQFCGANLFLLRSSKSSNAVRFWKNAGQFRKAPWRLVAKFGLLNLLRFSVGRLDSARAIEQVSQTVGARIGVIKMPFAEAGIDVDSLKDLKLAEEILALRTGKDDERGDEDMRGK